MTPFRRVLRGPLVVLLVLGTTLAACGPVTTTRRVADATVAVEAARVVEAERYATFEFVSAVEYLRKAREEEGYSDYQDAIDLATKARAFAEQAKARALNSPERKAATGVAPVAPAPVKPAPQTLGPAPVTAPAGGGR